MDGGGADPVRPQLVQQQAHRRHVGDGVQRAHLMEVDLRDRPAVDLRLGLGNGGVDRLHVPGHPPRPGAAGSRMASTSLRCRGGDGRALASSQPRISICTWVPETPVHHLLRPQLQPRDAQGVEAGQEALRVRVQLQQGGAEHIAGRAHAAVQIQRSHSRRSFRIAPLRSRPNMIAGIRIRCRRMPGNGVDEGAGQEHLKGEGVARQPVERQARQAPDQTARQHGGDEGDVDRLQVLLRKAGVQETADQTVDRQLEGHGHRLGINGGHAEEHRAQQRRQKAHRQPIGPAADHPAQQHGDVHT